MSIKQLPSQKKTKKIQSYILLNLAGADAILKAESFQYTTHESREDPEVLLTKFREQCMPTKNIIIDRYRFNTTNQKPTEPISSYVASLRILANKCEFGTLTDELIRDPHCLWNSFRSCQKAFII